MSVASVKTTPEKAKHGEILDVLGPHIQFLTALSDDDGEYCLIRGVIPAGVVVPLHSHSERETFYVLGGEVEAFWDDHRSTLRVGDVCDVPGGVKHGWQNLSDASASVLVVVPMRLGRFLRDIGRPAADIEPGAPTPADLVRLAAISRAYGYWLGSAADNAAAGISVG
jgi:quercetin dioxygenase-like cupin family protein